MSDTSGIDTHEQPTKPMDGGTPPPSSAFERLDDRQRKQLIRVGVLVLIALLIVTFIFSNTRQVSVSFIIFRAEASLIWVIITSLVMGFVAGWLLPGMIRRRWANRRAAKAAAES